MNSPLEGKRVLLGVTGSIACYKAVDLASRLTQAGSLVDVVLTKAARKFVTPLTFQSVTGRRAYTDDELWGTEGHVVHIELGKSADLVLVAPATANTLAKLAFGLADNLLTVAALAAKCPLLAAPAMDGGMYTHPATQANLETLRERGVELIGPAEGHLASGMEGVGRMVEPLEILEHVRLVFARSGPLAGHHVVVTAGGTQEPIDPVRTISNRSSGKQGFALARAALDMGSTVTLICGPVSLPTPYGALRIDVLTAQEMNAAVLDAVAEADALIMAAAVADFRPEITAEDKIKKSEGTPVIRLQPTPDVLANLASVKAQTGWPRVTVGFAAESQDLLHNARIKLAAKKMDMIVANDIGSSDAGFEVDTNRVNLLYPDGHTEPVPQMKKSEVAALVLERVVDLVLSAEERNP